MVSCYFTPAGPCNVCERNKTYKHTNCRFIIEKTPSPLFQKFSKLLNNSTPLRFTKQQAETVSSIKISDHRKPFTTSLLPVNTGTITNHVSPHALGQETFLPIDGYPTCMCFKSCFLILESFLLRTLAFECIFLMDSFKIHFLLALLIFFHLNSRKRHTSRREAARIQIYRI